jgi:transposase
VGAARRLSLPTSTLANWVKAYKACKLGDVGKTYRLLTEAKIELAPNKKELAEVKMDLQSIEAGEGLSVGLRADTMFGWWRSAKCVELSHSGP